MSGFICQADEQYLSACKDLPKYSGTHYCVLHYPDEKNIEDFLMVLESKLDRNDYDFGGTVFPEGISDFEEFEFDGNVIFAGASTLFSTVWILTSLYTVFLKSSSAPFWPTW